MSRDFTPREQYMVSSKMDPSYFMLNVKIKYGPTDEEKSLFSEEEKQVILHYPIRFNVEKIEDKTKDEWERD